MDAHRDQPGSDHRHCDEVLRELYSFVDGELTVESRAQIRYHLDNCLPCFEAYDFEAELRMVIAQRCREHVPDSLRDRIARAIESEGPGLPGAPPPLF